MEDDRRTRPFADWLTEQRKGLTHAELSEGLQQLVEAVAEVRKGGKLTLVVEIKPATKGSGNMVVVADKVKLDLPEPARDEYLFFIDDDMNLSRSNPDAPQLPLRALDGAEREPTEETGTT